MKRFNAFAATNGQYLASATSKKVAERHARKQAKKAGLGLKKYQIFLVRIF